MDELFAPFTPVIWGFLTCVVGAILLAPVWFWLDYRILKRLRERHPATYDAMGSPVLFGRNPFRGWGRYLIFLFSRGDRVLADVQLSRWLMADRVFYVFYLTLLAFFMYLALLAFFIMCASVIRAR